MSKEWKVRRFAFGLWVAAFGLIPTHASAITTEVAKACDALVVQQFPPRVPGNPAAGSSNGNGQSQQDYFRKCVANGGKTDDSAGKDTKPSDK